MNDSYVYDIECYPNVFTLGIIRADNERRWIFEISDRINQIADLVRFIRRLADAGCRMVGFNNVAYDYPLLHHIVTLFETDPEGVTAAKIHEKSAQLIAAPFNDWSQQIPDWHQIVPQIDLFKTMHFDNASKATSLKKLEMVMRSASVEELPFPPGEPLRLGQIDPLIKYMCWDIHNTLKFAREIWNRVEFRDQLSAKSRRTLTNYNDTRLGKSHFIDKLKSSGIECYTYRTGDGRREAIQTQRDDGIHVARNLLPLKFRTPELRAVWQRFHDSVIDPRQIVGFFKDFSATLNGFRLDFGAGGIHGSVNNRSFYTDEKFEIIDIDVASYYPAIAIANRFYPEHLTERFCDIYADLKTQRLKYPKKSPESEMLKLALNGVYGDSNQIYSPFYDPAYTMAITINGQLLLAQLAESLLTVPGLELIQANTDGLTMRVPRQQRGVFETRCLDWQRDHRLDLEAAVYKSIHARDVNNYVAIYSDDEPREAVSGALKWDHKPGQVKRKNAYVIEPDWHKDHSSLVVPKAVDAFLQHGVRLESFIFTHDDPFDFIRHVNVPRSSHLMWGDERVQNVSRYYIALRGRPLVKVMPPLAKEPDKWREIGIDVGWRTQMCNDVRRFDWATLNRRWYVKEAEKLLAGLGLSG